jgi:glycosyltransferase involved in cell wall biosynthesis
MACGVPCVVTDVGDARLIVGDTGRVVPPRAPEVLARAWAELLALPEAERIALGRAARDRVRERFSLDRARGLYEAIWQEVAAKCYEDFKGL